MNGSFWRRGTSRGYGAGRALLCAAFVLGPVMLLAACGSIQESGSGAASAASPSPSAAAGAGAPSAQAALCRDAGTVTSLEIERNHGTRIPQMQNAMPDQVTISNPASARAVARALCALPRMPHGPYRCPALFIGTTYHLIFTAGGRHLPTVTIEATGCETVTGVGPVRRAATSSEFWRVLDLAAGKPARGPSIFSGGGPSCQPPSTQTSQHNGCPGVAQPGGVS